MRFTPSPPTLVRAFDAAVDSLRGVERGKMFGIPQALARALPRARPHAAAEDRRKG